MAFGKKVFKQEDIKNIKYPKGSKVLIVDADTVAFRVASASDKKSILVTSPSGRKKEFKNRTKFKKWKESNKLNFNDSDYKIEDLVKSEPLSFCLNTLKRKMDALKKTVDANYIEVYFGGNGNFRLDLPLIDKYKGQRPAEKPTHLRESHLYLQNNYDSKEIVGVETDDIVQQRLVEISKQDGVEVFLATIDKDAYQVFDEVNYNIVDIKENEIHNIDGGFGKIYFNNATVPVLKGDGFIWLMSQVFLFDSADNYKMNTHYKKKFGQKGFFNEFNSLCTHKDVLEKMKELWLKLLPDNIEYFDWYGKPQKFSRLELAELYFSCAYMRLKPNDEMKLEDFFIKYGVSVEELK